MDREDVIRSYFQALKHGDRAHLEQLLAPNLRHVSPSGVLRDRDSMLDQIWPTVGTAWAEELEIFGNGPGYMVRYRMEGESSGSIAEYLLFEGHSIVEIHVYVGRR